MELINNETTRTLPENLKSSLPSIEEHEVKLSGKEYIMRGGDVVERM
ncbi:MAG: hypothetical protein KAJ19_23090 [Gammaproteobacteria bacterium]|nr:hypothetical protein [Gammaproteobacteria bacterium]